MGIASKAELERKYKVPVYAFWYLVPLYLKTRSWWKQRGMTIPKDAQPDAVKGGGNMTKAIYFLFDVRKWGEPGLFEQIQKEAIESERR